MSLGIGPQVDISPRLQALEYCLQQTHILRIVPSHGFPGLSVAENALTPKFRAAVLYLAPHTKIAPDVIEFVAIKLESFSGEFKCVYSPERGRWLVAMNGETRVDFLNIEGIPIMSNNNISLIKDAFEAGYEPRIVLWGFFVMWVIRETIGLNLFVPFPEHGKAEQERIPLHPHDILNVA